VVGEPKLARDAEDGRLADRVPELAGGLERTVRLGRQHHQIGALHYLRVAATRDSELDRALPPSLRVT
jgi:hypothetical protein